MHNEYEELLKKYHEGICTEDEERILKEHLKTCDECKKALMEMEIEISSPDENEKVQVSENEYDNEMKVEEERLSKEKRKKIRSIVVGVVACVAIVVVYVGITRNSLKDSFMEYYEFYSEAYILPEEYIGEEIHANNEYVKEKYNKIEEYYIEKNDDYKEECAALLAELQYQAEETSTYEEVSGIVMDPKFYKIKIKGNLITEAEVWAYTNMGDEEFYEEMEYDFKFAYVVTYKRKGMQWKIEKFRYRTEIMY